MFSRLSAIALRRSLPRSLAQRAVGGSMMFSTSSRYYNPDRSATEQDMLLFTPGPLTTSYLTKKAMMSDLGSRDIKFIQVIQDVREGLLAVAGVTADTHTTVPMQGSGTFGVESVITSTINKDTDKLLIIVNGSYGARIKSMAVAHGIDHVTLEYKEDEQPVLEDIKLLLQNESSFTHVACIHSETTSGIVNNVEAIGQIVNEFDNVTYIVDAMSSFGGIPVSMTEGHIDYLVSSSNKCIEGVPGFSYVIAKKAHLETCQGKSDSVSLDLYAQWKGLDANGQFRFTPPTHAMLAFRQALTEFNEEGGVEARYQRYLANQNIIIEGLTKLGFEPYLSVANRGPIISSFRYPPQSTWDFETFYTKLNDLGLVIYPGKVSNADCFRIGHIGALDPADSENLLKAIDTVCQDMKIGIYA
jgi:2-aminoethylphosphonate-pyruvate transaminase